jgi:hypothetical protein
MGREIVPSSRSMILTISRPKKLEEVSAQEHAIAVLTKTLQSSNVQDPLFFDNGVVKSHALLRSSRNRKNLHHPRSL